MCSNLSRCDLQHYSRIFHPINVFSYSHVFKKKRKSDFENVIGNLKTYFALALILPSTPQVYPSVSGYPYCNRGLGAHLDHVEL